MKPWEEQNLLLLCHCRQQGVETSKKSSQFLTSVIPNLEQLSASLIYVQGLIIDCCRVFPMVFLGLITVNQNALSGAFCFVFLFCCFLSPEDLELKSSWPWLQPNSRISRVLDTCFPFDFDLQIWESKCNILEVS